MIEKKTIIDQIEVTRDGIVQIRFALLVVEDGKEIASSWHRTSVAPGQDLDQALVNVDRDITTRSTLRAAPIDEHLGVGLGKELLRIVVRNVHTPEMAQKYKAVERTTRIKAT
jgi:hypothetical protein